MPFYKGNEENEKMEQTELLKEISRILDDSLGYRLHLVKADIDNISFGLEEVQKKLCEIEKLLREKE